MRLFSGPGADFSGQNWFSAVRLMGMELRSPAFIHEGVIPDEYTCKGKDISPPIEWNDVPDVARSLALICHDPDAPVSGGFTHWVIWNIPVHIQGYPSGMARDPRISEGAMQGITSFKKPGYGGPCPPSGTHRYYFKLYALDTLLELSDNTRKEDLEQAMDGHIVEIAELMGRVSK